MQLLHKFLLITFLLFISCLSVYGQDHGHIAGIVKSVETESGLPGVIVELTELEMVNETDDKGAFQFLNVPAGTYSLAFMAPGYGRTVLLNVIVDAGQTWYDQIYIQKTKQEGEQFYIGGI